ncbi:glycosyltransferase [Pontibacter virosus]|uniref:Glycosyl transferase family 2 n=1 Tax=Pontibacter virosus TaxID=1765052 RepID=A0A2U1B2Z2_9BACT|nr:glycosyltransferase [Pontibacter virosus]PVY43033.1 glycosyl transferase family 2 [Pontibacter virosus]
MVKKKVTFALLSYNQEKYIEEAVISVLNQTYTPLEIIISDDCSSDSTFDIITAITCNYEGPHTIILNRNKKNIGLGGHFSKVFSTLSSGEYFVILGGDDVSKSDHVETAVSMLEVNPDVSMIDFNGVIINEEGKKLGTYQKLKYVIKKFSIVDFLNFKPIDSFAPGRIFKRSLITEFNPISNNCPTEDSVLVLRSLLKGGLLRYNNELVFYRKHSTNVSSKKNLAKLSNLAIIAQYFNDILKLFNDSKLNEITSDILIKRISIDYEIRKKRYNTRGSKVDKFADQATLYILKKVYNRILNKNRNFIKFFD